MSGLSDLRRAASAKRIADADIRLAAPRPRQRIDVALVTVIATLAAGSALGGLALASWVRASGMFDPPLVAEVTDPRILTDYRDTTSPMVDMVASGPHLLIGRENGLIDRFNMETRRFATESLPRSAVLSGALSFLSADCQPMDCSGAGTVHAVTDAGGLARRSGWGWEVILGDMAFVGADGTPVEQADVTGWTVSEDGTLVLVNAGAKGIGLFSQTDSSWTVYPPIADATHGPLFWEGAFWLAGPRGIHRIQSGTGTALALPIAGTEGEILDLALSESDGLVALRRAGCADGAAGCLSILRLSPHGQITFLHEETALHPALNDSGLAHVVSQADALITVGTAGVHRYDTAARAWSLIDSSAPTAILATDGGERLFLGLPGHFLEIVGGEVVTSATLDQPLVQIMRTGDDGLFGLDRAGQIVALGATAQVVAPADTGAPQATRFVGAAAIGARFVAVGPAGVLIHDSITRRYAFVPAAGLPPLPFDDAILVAGQDRLWIISGTTGAVQALTFSGDFPAIAIAVEEMGAVPGPIVRARAAGAGIDVITAAGGVHRVTGVGQITTLVGAPLPLALLPTSMAAGGDVLLFSDGHSIWGYDRGDRYWGGPDVPPPGRTIADIAIAFDRLLALDTQGDVHWRTETGWEPVIGGPLRAAFDGDAVQDALVGPGVIYFASDSTVQPYSPDARSFGPQWQAPGQRAELLAALGPAPIWTNSNGVYRGDTLIFGGDRFVDGWMGPEGPVGLLQADGRRYVTNGMTCLFHGTEPPTGEIRDVVQIDPARLIVRTDGGTGLYEPALHRWVRVDGLAATPGSRLLILGDHLVRLDPQGMASVPLADIPVNPACNIEPVTIDWAVSFVGRQASLVDGANEILLLQADGRVLRWSNGAVLAEAPAPGEGPVPTTLLGAWPSGDGIDFLTATALWHYRTGQRVWERVPFEGAPAQVTRADLVAGPDGRPVISLWDENDRLWIGRADVGENKVIRVTLAPTPVLPTIPIDPAAIRDIADHDGQILVLSDRRLLIYGIRSELPAVDIALPVPRLGWQLATDGSGALILADGNPAAPETIHRLTDVPDGSHDLADLAATYQPDTDRAWQFADEGAHTTLYRIDASLRSWKCDLAIGAREPDCTLLAAAPLETGAADIRAFDTATGVVMRGSDLIRLDVGDRQIAFDTAARIGSDSQLFSHMSDTYLWEGQGGALWSVRDGATNLILSRVDHLRLLDNRLAALVGTEVIGITGGDSTAPPALPNGEQVVHRHLMSSGEVVMTASGSIVANHGKTVSDPLLHFGSDTVTALPLLGLGPTGGMAWLSVLTDGATELHYVDECTIPAPEPPSLPAGFIGPPPPPVDLPPTREPCAQKRSLDLRLADSERLLDVVVQTNGAVQVLTDRRRVDLSVGDMTIFAESPLPQPDLGDAQARDVLRGRVATVDGRSFLSPPVLDPNRFSGISSPISFRPLVPVRLPAWDRDWISWQRQGPMVTMSAAGGPLNLTPAEAIRDGRFLPAHPGWGSALGTGGVAWINAHGLWHQQGDRLVQVAAQGMTNRPTLALGIFLAASGGIAAADGGATPGPAPRVVTAGALQITTDPVTQSVGATLDVDGQTVGDFAETGFSHDLRLSVAQSGMVRSLTPVGLVPVAGLDDTASLPPASDRLEAEGGQILARSGSGWSAFDPVQRQWSPVAAPFQNAILAQENGRIWERSGGQVVLAAARAGEDWRVARQGLAFDMDQLVAFAATQGELVAVTRAGTHTSPDLAGLSRIESPDAPAPPAADIDAMRAAPTRSVLFTRGSGEPLVWDRTALAWRSPAADERPWQVRQAVDSAGINIRFDPAPRFVVTIEDPVTGPQPIAFDWRAGQSMPFDHATTLHADPETTDILVGTDLGLRRLELAGASFVSGPLFGTGNDLPVAALGRPASTPDRIVAQFVGGTCLEVASTGDRPLSCAIAADLNDRFVTDGFWQWSEGGGAVRGLYVVDGAPTVTVPQPFQGHLPHDMLADRLTCGGIAVERWRDADILQVGATLIGVPGLMDLHCQIGPAILGPGQRIEPGLHVLTTSGALHFSGGRFQPTSAAVTAGLAERLAGRVVLDAGHLRYGLVDGAPFTQALDLHDVWHETPWVAGRLSLDQPLALAARDDRLQVVTAAGVADAPDGRIDPASLVVMTASDPSMIASCGPQRVEVLDGRTHAVAAAFDAPVRLFCHDGTWLEGVTDGTVDIGALAAVPGQPEERILVDATPLWVVRQEMGADGTPGAPNFSFRDEPARLSAGRFDLDTFRALAAPFAGRTEVLAESGWWRVPAGRPLLTGTERGPARIPARNVSALVRDLSARNGATGLCFDINGSSPLFWDGDQAVEASELCRETRGRDTLWSWWQAGDIPIATGISLNAVPLSRTLVAGRFADLIVTGAPRFMADGGFLVPGLDGVLVFGAGDSRPIALYALDPGGVLVAGHDGGTLYVGDQGVTRLQGAGTAAPASDLGCPALADLAASLPEGASILRTDHGDGDSISVVTQGAGPRRQHIIDCDAPGHGADWAAVVPITGHPRALALGDDGTTHLTLTLIPERITIADALEVAVAESPLGEVQQLLMRADGSETFVIDARTLWTIPTATAISTLAREGQAHPSDPAPDPLPEPVAEPAPPSLANTTSPPAEPTTEGEPEPDNSPEETPQDSTPEGAAPAPSPLPSASSAAEEADYDPLAVQTVLAQRIAPGLVLDGRIGPNSRAAIAAWQAEIGSAPTGYLGAEQAALLGAGP